MTTREALIADPVFDALATAALSLGLTEDEIHVGQPPGTHEDDYVLYLQREGSYVEQIVNADLLLVGMAAKRCGDLSGSRNKAGDLCMAYARTGQGKDTCIAHASKLERAELGFGGPEAGAKGGAAGRIPKLTELIKERLIEEADKVIERLMDGLDAEAALVVGNGKDAYVDSAPDYGMRLRTVREILDRTEGRPKSISEFTGKMDIRNGDQLDRAIQKELEREVQRLTERLAEAHVDEPVSA
jgi:hypothetical protein